MEKQHNLKDEIFSYHLLTLPFFKVLKLLFFPPKEGNVAGLKFSRCLFSMKLGENVLSPSRFQLKTVAFIGRWTNEDALNDFLSETPNSFGRKNAWHVRMKPYRKWGGFAGLEDAQIFEELKDPVGPVIGFTLAKLRISQTLRFTKWGKPVERQVRDHQGQKLALVSIRPPLVFSTFSIWETEKEMLSMVFGNKEQRNGENHQRAMQERQNKPFHHQFLTMRFLAFKESGEFEGQQNILSLPLEKQQ